MFFRNDGNTATRHVPALLDGITVRHVGEKIRLDTGIVKQGIALGGGTLGSNSFSLALLLNEECE